MLFALRSPLLLYPFRYFDPIRRRRILARYVAERHVIESSYAQWEITGLPEIRTGSATMFMIGWFAFCNHCFFTPFARIPGKEERSAELSACAWRLG